ncbi:MAG: tRNA (uridine(34)/cytosine(34)/5-carboxymethylaminomethyluridine(34)-2'-O)-methyltransferase TrmL [SAR86 cluster bacterium]|uniref:tRNA (cytidine(34)-2'-O)-methyltransferase n=1 Tax=SAR86 cluster bacterium TaxID=2030880 RepID=A0A2A5CJY8_9GAMM|nr:tRNA (uridine(34)/cytosine(34)/5-carboxymethylaminomethyluridine(34)-2'-O)-methyltransferase TrmL [Gammaproteobacteria bacterium AH-315-E17]PCJ43730.1 MAG: tRNA (uridine(34)/cytosine(34)/5-carboxymethylaminomethyluridine(34)-2'-O)-methyltransferase TrmL [SAR86 cluster bacterium]
MFNIVLFEPEIPPNTGNIIRLASNSGCQLHLIEPLGFSLDEKSLRRAGLDYHQYSSLQTYKTWQDFLTKKGDGKIFAFSTKGLIKYTDISYNSGDYLLFGPETRGLPEELRTGQSIDEVLTIPMQSNSRSLNLSNSAAIAVYEAWRQVNFQGS